MLPLFLSSLMLYETYHVAIKNCQLLLKRWSVFSKSMVILNKSSSSKIKSSMFWETVFQLFSKNQINKVKKELCYTLNLNGDWCWSSALHEALQSYMPIGTKQGKQSPNTSCCVVDCPLEHACLYTNSHTTYTRNERWLNRSLIFTSYSVIMMMIIIIIAALVFRNEKFFFF